MPPKHASEAAFLEWIHSFFPNQHRHVLLGRGDDCALLATPEKLLLSTDLFLEDVHFRRSYFNPGDIGHKSLAVNLSDLAAMGAQPLGFCLSLMLGTGSPDHMFWNDFFSAMATLAARHDLPLVGGDLSKSEKVGVSITIWGKPHKHVMQRGNCTPGDELFLCQHETAEHLRLGLARVGLMTLEEQGKDATNSYPAATSTHLRPTPLIEQGKILAACPKVKSLMDVSDGLARDLPRLLGEGVADSAPTLNAQLDIPKHHLHPELLDYAAQSDTNPSELAVLGGEDYALLGCGAPGITNELQQILPGTYRLGTVRQQNILTVNNTSFLARGFDHFGQ